jgi:hypothetical protein
MAGWILYRELRDGWLKAEKACGCVKKLRDALINRSCVTHSGYRTFLSTLFTV